jgi:hypothetical protein
MSGQCEPAHADNGGTDTWTVGADVESVFNTLHSDNQAGVCTEFGQYVLVWQYMVSGAGYTDSYDLTPYQRAGRAGIFPPSSCAQATRMNERYA